ncbi:MAG: beta-galactosidase trimerization domain-containing protein [Candidatus Latescibacterota bacterium]
MAAIPITQINNHWVYFSTDLNFRYHHHPAQNYGVTGRRVNEPGDYPGLSPQEMADWHRKMGSDTALASFKLQSGHATYRSKVLPMAKHLSPDFFLRFCEAAKKAGMYVFAYTCGGDDLAAYQEHPDWFSEYGYAFACLNSPFWDREFEAVQEALSLFPCDGLFYDMVMFSGKCRCDYCQEAYQRLYGGKMPIASPQEDSYRNWFGEASPNQEMIARFRYDTFKRWAERATGAGREIVPNIEISINQQWHRPDGIPYPLLSLFDWYMCEFDASEWVGEIMRAWGDKPLFCGNTSDPRFVAHLLARRIRIAAYDMFTDYRTGKFVSLSDRRVTPIQEELLRVGLRIPYVQDAKPIPHSAVLFSTACDWPALPSTGRPGQSYTLLVTTLIREATRMGLSCTQVVNADAMDDRGLDAFELVFAPELSWVPEELLNRLRRWVERGGILVASGRFALSDHRGLPLGTFADHGLLGLRKVEGPLPIFSVLTDFSDGDRPHATGTVVPFADAVVCESDGAVAVAHASVGAEDHVPAIWRNSVGQGHVFYLAGSFNLEEGPHGGAELAELRTCLRTLLFPHIRRAPFVTAIQYPNEVWLNIQPELHRLVLHMIAFEVPLRDQTVGIRSDLMVGETMQVAYPQAASGMLHGRRDGSYVHFTIPRVWQHLIATARAADVGATGQGACKTDEYP